MGLEPRDRFVAHHNHERENQDPAQRPRGRKQRGIVVNEVAEPFAGGDEFADDCGDDRVGQTDLQAGGDPRHDRRQSDLHEDLPFARSHDAQDVFELRVDALDAGEGVEESQKEHHANH